MLLAEHRCSEGWFSDLGLFGSATEKPGLEQHEVLGRARGLRRTSAALFEAKMSLSTLNIYQAVGQFMINGSGPELRVAVVSEGLPRRGAREQILQLERF